MTGGILVGHHDRTGAVLRITKTGVLRGKSWTRQTLSDAWESTNWEGLCGTPWQMVAQELRLTKKVTADKEGAGPHCQGLWLRECWRLNLEDSTFCLRTLKLMDTLEVVRVAQRLHRMQERQSHMMTNADSESEPTIERTLTGKARMNAYKDRIAETERAKEKKRVQVERGAGDVLMKPGNRYDGQMAVRHADASGGDITGNQHKEDRMRDIHVGKRGSGAASEEQLDKWRKTVQCEKEAQSAAASSEPLVAMENLASGETQDRPGSVLVQTSGHVDDDVQVSALDVFHEMGGPRSRIGVEEKMPEISREVK